ncbi:syntaxin 7 [Tieghemostelium lacteum]|uniref:Syntaxin 7 n=1 Tax=Tieghemostelium lacteum TaxID=361077 RepID=A0A152A1U7_TIELA|nr:syntaxin 7 [Tieghemostelium lacteum]|eukprot:KYR00190.1 syntaxin 7 [Tieghemostelium lacteum]
MSNNNNNGFGGNYGYGGQQNRGGFGGNSAYGGNNGGYGGNSGFGGNSAYGGNQNQNQNQNQNFGGGYNFNNDNVNNNYNQYNNNNSNMGNGGGDDVSNNADYQATAQNIEQIQSAVSNLQKLVKQLGTPRDSMEVREKIRSCVESTAQFIKNESPKVKNLTALSNRSSPKNKLLYQKLVKDYNDSLKSFKNSAQLATTAEKNTPLPVQQNASFNNNSGSFGGRNSNNFGQQQFPQGNNSPYFEDNREDESQSLMESSRRQQLQQIEAEREYHNSIIQERDEDIKQIEQSIYQINEIFIDLSQLVGEQGVMLNNIESNLESTYLNTKEANVQLNQASKHQQSSRNKMCWLALILLIVAAVLGIILFFSLRK